MRAPRRPRAVLASAVLAAALSLTACASAPAGSASATRAARAPDVTGTTDAGAASTVGVTSATSATSATDLGRKRGRAADVSLRHIQGEALARDPSRSLMDVMASYWPNAMRGDPHARQIGGEQGIGAYVNGNYMGGWDFLRTVRAGEVLRVQRLTQSEEFLQYGRTHANGAVVLTFRGGLGR
jgi:mRNA-degrading endonuclease toxin of MazEF toxin-antitoxin module